MQQETTRTEQTVRSRQVDAGELRQAPFPAGPAVRVVVGAGAGEPVGVLEVTPEHEHGDSDGRERAGPELDRSVVQAACVDEPDRAGEWARLGRSPCSRLRTSRSGSIPGPPA